MIRIHVGPDGTVSNVAVRTSTSPNPSLDADVAKAMLGWKMASSSGGDVDIDYPVIFATDGSEQSRIESDLQTKLASLSPNEPSEYASAPEPSPAAAPSASARRRPKSPRCLPRRR